MESLQKSVQSVINAGRIGSPVFVRCLLQSPLKDGDNVGASAALANMANAWMPSLPEQIYVQQSQDGTQTTTMIQYAGGQTALLSVNRVPANQEVSIDLTLVGNKGAIYHETPRGQYRLMRCSIQLHDEGNLSDLISQAIASGEPVNLRSEE